MTHSAQGVRVALFFVCFIASALGQPWTHSQGNNQYSAFVRDAPLTPDARKDFRLRWQISNLSTVLAEARIPNAELFESYTVPLTPNLQTPGNDHVFLLTNEFVLHCDVNVYHDYPCVRTYLAALNGTTGKLSWMTKSNITWNLDGQKDSFPFWVAGAENVYVAVEPGIKNYWLEAYEGATGTRRWSYELPYVNMYIGGFPHQVLEATTVDIVIVSMPQHVIALSRTTGKQLWKVVLPNTTVASSSSYIASTTFLVESLNMVIVSYTAFQEYAATIAFDLQSGDTVWTSPYYTGNTAGESVSTGFNPPATDGEKYLYFQSPISYFSIGIAVLNLVDGTLARAYYLDYDHNFVGSNFIAWQDGGMSCVFGSDTDYSNPSYSFNATTGKNESFYVNGTNDFNANNYASSFGVEGGVAYAFSQGNVIAFSIPRVSGDASSSSLAKESHIGKLEDEEESMFSRRETQRRAQERLGSASSSAADVSILWSVPVNEPFEPSTLQALGNGQRYLGNGRFMVVGTNENSWDHKHLKCIQMFF